VLALARLGPVRQRAVVGRLRLAGKLPRSLEGEGEPATITVPREPRAMAEALRRRRGRDWLAAFCEVVIDLLAAPEGGESR
jgi:hypothetical protein